MIERQEDFKTRFNRILEIREMRPVDLAKATGFKENAISQWRSGYAEPKADKIAVLAKVLKVDPVWLIGMDVPMELPPLPERFNADFAEMLIQIKNTPLLTRLCVDFMRLDSAQQQNVVNLVHSMIPDKRP